MYNLQRYSLNDRLDTLPYREQFIDEANIAYRNIKGES